VISFSTLVVSILSEVNTPSFSWITSEFKASSIWYWTIFSKLEIIDSVTLDINSTVFLSAVFSSKPLTYSEGFTPVGIVSFNVFSKKASNLVFNSGLIAFGKLNLRPSFLPRCTLLINLFSGNVLISTITCLILDNSLKNNWVNSLTIWESAGILPSRLLTSIFTPVNPKDNPFSAGIIGAYTAVSSVVLPPLAEGLSYILITIAK